MLDELTRRHGYRVLRAHHAIDALLMLEEERPDVVVLDIAMPDLDGFEVASIIRTRWGTSLRIIALTGLSGADLEQRALGAGFDLLLTKPIQRDHFLGALRGHFGNGAS